MKSSSRARWGAGNKLARAHKAKRFVGAAFFAGFSLFLSANAADVASTITSGTNKIDRVDVMDMDLTELMNIKVTSPSKRPEKLADAAAAIYVITQEDIRRSGVTSIPEALRLAPGMEVARQDAHTWAISSRGFNDEFANQLLVLIDGRSVYTPLFAGVYWDVQDLPLEDINRIEVIRGPGAALWGANAVNGVINITTKRARDTQGILVTGGGGNEEQGFATVRYGGKVGDDLFYRIYGKVHNNDNSSLPNGLPADDRWTMWQGGFRMDWEPGEQNLYTLQGDLYTGTLNQGVTVPLLTPPFAQELHDPVNVSGANVLGRWNHQFSANADLALKVYYDRTDRDRVVFAERRDTFDLDLQHHFQWGNRQDIVVGLGYNVTADELDNRFAVSFNPTHRTASLYSGFVQDEIQLIPNRLRLTLGTKVEHNDYTGWEVQPSGRLSWSITKKQTAWFAASRAISTPSRAEDDIRINRQVFPAGVFGPAPALISQFGSRSMDSKELIAFELGYRIQPHYRVTLDVATFYNIYDRQRSLEQGTPFVEIDPLPPHAVIPFTIGNLLDGETYGVELASSYQLAEWWRVHLNYSYLNIQLHKKPGSTDLFLEGAEHDSPRHQFSVRSQMDLPQHFELDMGFRYVDALSNRDVPSYTAFDARLGWRPNKNWEFSIVGQNLFNQHKEFAPSYILTQTTEVETSVFGKITFRY
jgi:iron complex outermembrane receptor protein